MTERRHERDLAVVNLWGQRLGAVVEDSMGSITFEYDEQFRRSGLEVSPLRLPLSRIGPVNFPELARKEAFDGLPGLLADSLPDDFGNRIARRHFQERGRGGQN